MNPLPLLALALAAVFTASAGATGSSPFTAPRTTACLSAHSVLASPLPRTQALPAHYPLVAAIQISFALIPAQALDHGFIVFEKDPATAKRVEAAWIAYSILQAARVQGIDQNQAKQIIESSVSLSGNAIVSWDNRRVKAASRKRVLSCLR